ncbi:hypothetical protein CLV62_13717 [Dysgonomonas alginatilytica]|uniref:Uncharacterized protein n=1 Tax=Dysgonomonas alginatilytica TaxID=1605892 RepID=A0A2V3PKJ4_9BACT|nr:hypothetical protein CLV62_13717 [Dysgonomonas alginatilytica]
MIMEEINLSKILGGARITIARTEMDGLSHSLPEFYY